MNHLKGRLLRANWYGIASATLLVAVVLAGLHLVAAPSWADEDDDAESTITVPSRASVKNGLTVLTLNAAARQSAGIETALLKPAPASQTITAYGTVVDPASLTQLRNTFLSAQAQVQTAQAKLTVARAAYERAKTLNQGSTPAVSLAALQSAQGEFGVDQAALAAAQSALSKAAADTEQSWGSVLGKALIDGTPLAENIIARRTYLVKVTLPAATSVPEPPATVSAKFGSGQEAQLRLISLGTSTDPRLQGVSYFYSVAAESGLLPGMTIVVPVSGKRIAGGFIMPEAAAVWLQGKAWIYRQSGTDTFVRREISPHTPAPAGGYIVTGLPPDSRIVIRGAQMLLSEEFRATTTAGADTD